MFHPLLPLFFYDGKVYYLCIMTVSVVIVSMDRPDILKGCLDSLFDYNRTEMEVFVVAYRYSKEHLESLKRDYPGVKVIVSDGTRGFAENNNLALDRVTGEFVLILNDDTEMALPVVDRLLWDIDRLGENVATVSPKIVFPSGKVQTCGRAPWTMCRYMLHYLHLVNERRRSRWSMRPDIFRTKTLNGACFLARTEAFRKAGWFDERFFFTPEDIALGRRFEELGYEQYADANVQIVHYAGGTTGPLEAAIKPARVRGAMLFYAGESQWRRSVLGGFIYAVESLRVFKYWLFGHRSPRRSLMYRTAQNVRGSVFSRETPKEIFQRYSR